MVETLSKTSAITVTVPEFLEMDFPDTTDIYELINGKIVRRSSPNPPHQLILGNVYSALKKWVSEKQLGWVFLAPLDVFLDNKNCVQPDIFFISKERDFIIHDKNGITGAPDLVIEIISPGTARFDRGAKKETYEMFAVKEYWIVDPRTQSVEIYVMTENAYRLHNLLEVEGTIGSKILEGFEIEISEIFN